MRIVTFEGRPVKKQRRTKDGLIRVSFYDGTTEFVTLDEWLRKAADRFHGDGERRSEVAREAIDRSAEEATVQIAAKPPRPAKSGWVMALAASVSRLCARWFAR